MKDDDNFNATLAAATYALLGSAVATPVVAQEEGGRWSFDSTLLYYGESDDRVRDVSAAVSALREFADDRKLSATLTADTLTGASPSGAIALDRPQTFTSPSGRAVYTTAAGDVPLDDTFHDTRYALNASWTQPLARLYSFSAGLGFSTEYDYTHLGANLSLARDFNKRNTTLSTGLAYSQDDVDPVGGRPIPLSQMLDVGDNSNKRNGGESKDILDLLLGFTQVLNRTTVLRVNYSYSDSSGYLTDPYKLLSLVDPVTGDTLAHLPVGLGADGVYLFESRPDTRTKQSLYAEVKHAFGTPVMHFAYRFMTDDWGIDSHTGEVRLRWPLGDGYVEPQLRYYTQSAADFYHASLVSGAALPRYASADFRLGDFDATTIGIKYGHATTGGNEWSIRAEYYQQDGSVPRDQIVGNQANREQYPDLSAVVVQFGYRFRL
jgi:hypothetical protein